MDVTPSDVDLQQRATMLRLGPWLGWASIAAVLAGGVAASHRELLIVLALAAAALNAAAMLPPWRTWLGRAEGRLLLDAWSGALIAFVALLVVLGGPNFAFLLFLTVPFIALVQTGRRRVFWLAVSGTTCVVVAVFADLPPDVTLMRSGLLGAAVALALFLTSVLEREVGVERARVAEANHRIKNNLQAVADLLVLERPPGDAGRAFDETARRIQSIASLHRLLAETGDALVDGAALLATIADAVPLPVTVDAVRVAFDPSRARQFGIVANELITNAVRHGAGPISVSLRGRGYLILRVDDGGRLTDAPVGLGLELVRQTVERGLGGAFRLGERPGGGTRAEVVFPEEAECAS